MKTTRVHCVHSWGGCINRTRKAEKAEKAEKIPLVGQDPRGVAFKG